MAVDHQSNTWRGGANIFPDLIRSYDPRRPTSPTESREFLFRIAHRDDSPNAGSTPPRSGPDLIRLQAAGFGARSAS